MKPQINNGVRGALLAAFVLAGVAGLAADSPIPKAGLALWLTAGDVVVENGKVTQLKDRSGQYNDAVLMDGDQLVAANANPRVVKHEQCGQPVVRFDGTPTGYRFGAITNIRSVFWVVTKSPAAFHQKWGELFVLAGKSTADFHPGKHFLDTIIGSPASAHLKQGKLRFNGFPSDPFYTEYSSNRLAAIAMVATGDVRAEQVATDRNLRKRWWNGDIAEIIVYTVPLADTDRQSVEQYLLDKCSITPFRPVVITPAAVEAAAELNKQFDANRQK